MNKKLTPSNFVSLTASTLLKTKVERQIQEHKTKHMLYAIGTLKKYWSGERNAFLNLRQCVLYMQCFFGSLVVFYPRQKFNLTFFSFYHHMRKIYNSFQSRHRKTFYYEHMLLNLSSRDCLFVVTHLIRTCPVWAP